MSYFVSVSSCTAHPCTTYLVTLLAISELLVLRRSITLELIELVALNGFDEHRAKDEHQATNLRGLILTELI